MVINKFLLVALGGAIGSVLRYCAWLITKTKFPNHLYLSTISVNIFGCFLIGFISFLIIDKQLISKNLSLILLTGFCGGFTTFSTFALDFAHLEKLNNLTIAVFYICLSVILGILGVYFGFFIAQKL